MVGTAIKFHALLRRKPSSQTIRFYRQWLDVCTGSGKFKPEANVKLTEVPLSKQSETLSRTRLSGEHFFHDVWEQDKGGSRKGFHDCISQPCDAWSTAQESPCYRATFKANQTDLCLSVFITVSTALGSIRFSKIRFFHYNRQIPNTCCVFAPFWGHPDITCVIKTERFFVLLWIKLSPVSLNLWITVMRCSAWLPLKCVTQIICGFFKSSWEKMVLCRVESNKAIMEWRLLKHRHKKKSRKLLEVFNPYVWL